MSKIDHRALCRKAAAECVEFARMIADPEIKKTLLTRAQEWLKLAYAEHDTDFERLLTGFNKDQMGSLEQGAHRVQAMPMQPQPVHNSKQKPSGETS